MTMAKTKRFGTLAAVGLVGVTTGFLFGGTQSEATDTASANANAVTVTGCVIRFEDRTKGPVIHENGTHACTGARSVRVVGGDLEIKQKVGGRIVSMNVEEDETMSTKGIIGGPSGGGGTTIVKFYDIETNEPFDIDGEKSRIWGPLSNIWVTWVHEG